MLRISVQNTTILPLFEVSTFTRITNFPSFSETLLRMGILEFSVIYLKKNLYQLTRQLRTIMGFVDVGLTWMKVYSIWNNGYLNRIQILDLRVIDLLSIQPRWFNFNDSSFSHFVSNENRFYLRTSCAKITKKSVLLVK